MNAALTLAIGCMSMLQQANEPSDAAIARQEWFREAKVGFIIHYSLFSLAPCDGLDPFQCNMEMRSANRAVDGYGVFAGQFRADAFQPVRWMRMLKDAGGRYVVFGTKHHDGFCLFDTALTDYDSVDTAAGYDLVRRVVEGARANDMKIVLYYSMLDWHHPAYHDDLPSYVTYMHGQVKELCTNYGPIDGVWFDGEWDHPYAAWRSDDLVSTIRACQPGAIVNDRLGVGERGKTTNCDFFTREQPDEIDRVATFEGQRAFPWEACMTAGNEWVYREDDVPLKPASDLIRRMVDVVSRGGNYLLNLPLAADGSVPPAYPPLFEALGTWLGLNGESIYGTYGSPFPKDATPAPPRCTTKGNRLYLHLFEHPGAALRLPRLQNQVKRVWLLADGRPLDFDPETWAVSMPEVLPDAAVTTIAMELDGEPRPVVK